MVKHTKKMVNQKAFLNAYRESACVIRAARAAKIDRTTHYLWMSKEPGYVERFEETRRQAVDVLTAEATRRAKDGIRRLKFFQGVPCMVPVIDEKGKRKVDSETGEEQWEPYVEHDYSDTLLIFLMKAADPARFNDRLMVETHGKVAHEHAGQIDVRAAVVHMQQDPAYVDYLNKLALDGDGVPAEDGSQSE